MLLRAEESIAERTLETIDRTVVESHTLADIAHDETLSTEEKIHRIAASNEFGHPANGDNLIARDLTSTVQSAQQARQPLQFVLPAFPFKDAGAFNTEAEPSHPDLGEAVLLARLHTLMLALAPIHAPYAELVIISDGRLYAPIFGLSEGIAVQYVDALRSLRNRMNLGRTVHIVDYVDLIELTGLKIRSKKPRATGRLRLGTSSMTEFMLLASGIRRTIGDLVNDDDEVRQAFGDLVAGMMWNLPTRKHLTTSPIDDIWSALRGDNSSRLFREINEDAIEAAYRYAATNIALGTARILQIHFPLGIRMTSHAKPGQIAMPRVGSVSPWNGVAVLKRTSDSAQVIEVTRAHNVWATHKRYYLRGSGSPFYYAET